jgi:hypothetical protein
VLVVTTWKKTLERKRTGNRWESVEVRTPLFEPRPGPRLICECGVEAGLDIDIAVYLEDSWAIRTVCLGCGTKTVIWEA